MSDLTCISAPAANPSGQSRVSSRLTRLIGALGGNLWNNSSFELKGPDKHATWTLSGLAKGSQWQVYTTWSRTANFPSPGAPYTVNGGLTKLDQNPAPASDLVMTDLDGIPANF